MTGELWIHARGQAEHLIPPDAEYHGALPVLVDSIRRGALGMELCLHVYAHELVERARIRVRETDGALPLPLLAPLWPTCLARALAVEAPGLEDQLALLPPLAVAYRVPTDEELVAASAEVLGGFVPDAGAYRAALAEAARDHGWRELA